MNDDIIVILLSLTLFSFFFFNDTATTEIYTLSLHDALPISARAGQQQRSQREQLKVDGHIPDAGGQRLLAHDVLRSEEHTSELQSPCNLVCRLLLEKKKKDLENLTSVRLFDDG